MARSARTLLVAAFLSALSVAARGADIAIGDPYARAVPPGQPNSAVFMSLENRTGVDRALMAAESPACETVELHTHVEEGGMMRMRRIEKIELPGGRTVMLEPGALHLMLIGLRQPLEAGDVVEVTLILDDGARLPVEAPVRRIAVQHKGH